MCNDCMFSQHILHEVKQNDANTAFKNMVWKYVTCEGKYIKIFHHSCNWNLQVGVPQNWCRKSNYCITIRFSAEATTKLLSVFIVQGSVYTLS